MCWPVDRPATHAAAGAAARGVRGWGVESAARGERWSAHSAPSRRWSDATSIMRFLFLWGALLLFVLRVVAGACVGRWTGQPRMPPRERLHEGLGGLGVESVARGDHRSGHSAPCRHRVTARGLRHFGFFGGGLFHTLGRGCERIPLSSASASLSVQSLRDSAPLPDDDRRANSNNPRGATRRIKRAG